MKKSNQKRKALKAAFPHTIPIFACSVELAAVNMLLVQLNKTADIKCTLYIRCPAFVRVSF